MGVEHLVILSVCYKASKNHYMQALLGGGGGHGMFFRLLFYAHALITIGVSE